MPSQIRLRMGSPGQMPKRPAQPQPLRLMRKVRHLLLDVKFSVLYCRIAKAKGKARFAEHP